MHTSDPRCFSIPHAPLKAQPGLSSSPAQCCGFCGEPPARGLRATSNLSLVLGVCAFQDEKETLTKQNLWVSSDHPESRPHNSSKPFPVHSAYPAEHLSIPTQKVEEKLEHWVDKYENDTDAKEEELDALKALKANNLEMLQRLATEVRQQQHLSAQPCKATSRLFPTLR